MTDTNPLKKKFLDAMRSVATPVSVVTTDGPGGRFGLTVSSFNSVSADPPVISVCINQRSPMIAALARNGRMNVNVLTEAGGEIASVFAGQAGRFSAFDFACATWSRDDAGLPVLDDALSTFSCAITATIPTGSHMVFLCAVESVNSRDAHTLLHYRREFCRPVSILSH
ncbi:flavin reductase family protein [Komagataeibacter sp. SM21]|uniref:flavin reductase family protein n=1 Tax=Komagataeibacter sp. SM21 TaxID=3242899 RepID=UPI0035277CD5